MIIFDICIIRNQQYTCLPHVEAKNLTSTNLSLLVESLQIN